MGRLRIVFVLLALGLLIPSVLLVRRALESVLVERAVRHRTVAERIFDEMERSLSTFLAAEEERPVGHYRHAWSPPGSPASLRLRSPLADPPSQAFVVGHFEVDGIGEVRTPLRPGPGEAPADWPAPSEQARAAADRLLQLATQAWPAAPALAEPEQKPGTTVAVGRTARLDETLRKEAEPQERELLADAYGALQSLNRGAEQRSKRSQKVVVLKPGSYGAAEPDSLAAGDASEPAAARLPGRVAEERAASSRVLPERESGLVVARNRAAAPSPGPRRRIESASGGRDFDDAPVADEAQAPGPGSTSAPSVPAEAPRSTRVRAPSAAAPEPLRQEVPPPVPELAASAETAKAKLEQATAPKDRTAASSPIPASSPEWIVDPMLGFALDPGHLVLHRTVWRGQRAIRQGLIVEVAALEQELLGTVLPSGAFPGAIARVRPGDAPAPPTQPGSELFHYRHRFAEPFDALRVDLALPALEGASGPRTIYLLSLLLLLAGSVGFFALYRMVGVVVGFSERRSNFVAAVSHELKTPLTAIRMYAEMLRDGMVEGEDRKTEYYGTITAESERLSRLIDNVLEFSRLEKGTREISWVVGDLGALVAEAVGMLSPHAEAQGFQLRAEIGEDLPTVRFDRDAVMQVLFNLVDNALKYARDARDKTVVVSCRREGEGVQLSVSDRGPGVAGEHMKKMFEPFYRGESELTRRAQGTGIGLSLVKGLAEQMNAVLQAANRPEGGLQVTLRFQPVR